VCCFASAEGVAASAGAAGGVEAGTEGIALAAVDMGHATVALRPDMAQSEVAQKRLR
jgi:hypothetical protein